MSWTVALAAQNGAWRGELLRRLRVVRPAVPREWSVIVLADRGLCAS